MIIYGYDCWKRNGLSRRRKLESVGAETIEGKCTEGRGKGKGQLGDNK